MYAEDSFFTLTLAGRAAVLLLSALMFAGLLAGTLFFARRLPRLVALAMALGMFAGFVWLSPQAYYQLYRLIFDGLPAQIVVPPRPDLAETARILAFSHRATLSFHAQGALGWALIAVALSGGRRRRLSP